MLYSQFEFSMKDSIGRITLNKPDSLNTLNESFFPELMDVLKRCRHDDSCRVLIFIGSGERAFCAGADMHLFLEYSKKVLGGKDLSRMGQRAFQELEKMGKPSIAGINGVALGGGCELALACTFRIGSENSRLGLTEVNVGLIPGWGGSQRLSRLIGKPRAMEMILTGEIVDAAEACRIGLIQKVVPHKDLMDACEALAGRIIKSSPLAVRLAMEAVSHGLDVTLEEGQLLESNLAGYACHSEDAREGVTAFFEKRKPNFKGR